MTSIFSMEGGEPLNNALYDSHSLLPKNANLTFPLRKVYIIDTAARSGEAEKCQFIP